MNTTGSDNIGRDSEVSTPVLVGIVAGGGVLVIAIVTVSAIIATVACHSRRNTARNKIHISIPVRPFSIKQSGHSPSLTPRVTDEQLLQELHGCLQDRSHKTTFDLKEKTEPGNVTTPSSLNATGETETALDDDKVPFQGKLKIQIHHQTSQPQPITSLSPAHTSEKNFSFSISKRPRLPTPNTSKVANSNRITPVSPTPITQVRTSQWYDNIRMMLRPLTHYRHSGRSLEESCGHYINEGLGPPKV